eukprot:2597280-Alexandrium_andersonii.AAC.1
MATAKGSRDVFPTVGTRYAVVVARASLLALASPAPGREIHLVALPTLQRRHPEVWHGGS